jgi:small multidrug resistance pump
MKWLILIAGILSNASASVLIKLAMMPPHRFPTLDDPLGALRNVPLMLGLILYGGAFLLYAAALAKLPLNVAHPILTAGAVGTVALASALILREPFPWTTILGIVFVALGVGLVSLAAR